jgi:hypothetical protein
MKSVSNTIPKKHKETACLCVDLAASLMNAVRNILPALDMLVVPNARSVGPFSAASQSVRIDKIKGNIKLYTLGGRSERLQ